MTSTPTKLIENRPLFTAVLLDLNGGTLDDDENNYFHPLLDNDEYDDESFERTTTINKQSRYVTIIYFIFGSIFGIMAAFAGYFIMMKLTSDTSDLNAIQIISYALTWSSGSTLIGFCILKLFNIIRLSRNDNINNSFNDEYEHINTTEIFFAFGVFCGFCFGCFTVEAIHGLSFLDLYTVVFAVTWGAIVSWFAANRFFIKENKQRKATILPMNCID